MSRVKPLIEALESIEVSKSGALTATGEIELEMQDQVVKFKIGKEVWEAGVSFDSAVRLFGGQVSTDGLPHHTSPIRGLAIAA